VRRVEPCSPSGDEQAPTTCRLCGDVHIDPSATCSICGGRHDGEWHRRVGCMAVWKHLSHSSPGLPRAVLDDPLLKDDVT